MFPLPPTFAMLATAHQLFPGSRAHHFLLQRQPLSRPHGFPRQQARQQPGHPLCLRPFAPRMEFSFRKLTVHHRACCSRQRVVTSQAERPSAHGGVQEIFLSPRRTRPTSPGVAACSADGRERRGRGTAKTILMSE